MSYLQECQNSASELEAKFPEKVIILPEGLRLYHGSKDPWGLLSRNRFDYRLSKSGAFYFTAQPTIYSNTQVDVHERMVLFDYSIMTDAETERLTSEGNGNFWIGGMNLGFDGRISRDRDAMTLTDTGACATEIVVFPKSLLKLGKIRAYPEGSETTLFPFIQRISTFAG
jgi:hypothetical protein